MLEDSKVATMEKNRTNGRAGSGPSKSSGPESKSNAKQDAATNKVNRVGRRRESPCPRPEVWRKPAPQKNKGFDKRPKPRGMCVDGRERNNIANGLNVEVGSALQQGSKKMNLNHLLNFKYSSRGANASNWAKTPLRNRNKWNSKKHRYNKEQFLQANCQFVVRAGRDYAIHAIDPDLLVDWDAIELVRLSSQEVPSCPVCLYQPIAAKMTRCGHIYCWPCILHYLALSDKTWRKCPICFEAVHKTDLKSVVSLLAHQYTVGEEITLRLMHREKGSVFATAKEKSDENKGKLLRLDDADENTCFAKLLTASPDQVLKQVVRRERRELDIALSSSRDDPESCFIDSALELLSKREENLINGQIVEQDITENDKTRYQHALEEVKIPNNVPTVVYSCAFSNELKKSDKSGSEKSEDKVLRQRQESVSSSYDEGGATAEDLDIETTEEKSFKNAYYFYQACNGQHVYMHAMNAHMLIKEYGSLENSPETVRAKIVEKEEITMTEELRRRLRYLSHLPLSCEFEVVELQLKPPIVSKETEMAFEGEVEKRRTRRNKRARDEKRRERHIQEVEKRKLGTYPKPRYNLESHHQFPEYVPENGEFVTISDSDSQFQNTSVEHVPNSLDVSSPSTSVEDGCSSCGSVPSFAQMLRQGKAKGGFQTAASKPIDAPHRLKGDDSDTDSENYAPVPDYHNSFADAIQAALLKATLVDKVENSAGKKKKKGGKQKQLLFTTSMSRSK
uniref:E3 ubiquitin-protein ligase RNF10 n=1 Tax=Strigamia maritima TaxID=126957 RepID=T1J2K6_STRMM